MDKKFETLADLYKGFQAFRVAMQSLHKAHSDFLNHLHSDCYARWNDESVEYCRGVIFTALCLGFIDACTFNYFNGVLRRYKSYW